MTCHVGCSRLRSRAGRCHMRSAVSGFVDALTKQTEGIGENQEAGNTKENGDAGVKI